MLRSIKRKHTNKQNFKII